MKATKRFATAALAVSLAAGLVFAARADQFIKDVLLIGGTSGETYTQKTNFMAQGWTFIDYDLNKGAGGDYVYLMYKTANTPGCNACYGYITEFYIKDSGDAPDTLTVGGKTYHLASYYGGDHFRTVKGDLNSGTGNDTASIHLYYTKDVLSPEKAVTSVSIDGNSSSAVSGVNLNKGCGSSSADIYMHRSVGGSVSTTVDISELAMNYEAANGITLTGTNRANYKVSIANNATVTLNGVTINTRSGLTASGLTCIGNATLTLAASSVNKVTGSSSVGVFVPAGSTLTINGTGSLSATGNGNAAGIGSGQSGGCGNITISSGTVTATKSGTAVNSIGHSNGSYASGTVTIGGTITGPIKQSPAIYSSTDTASYTITFNGNGNTGGSTAAISSRRNTPKQIPANGFTRTGYAFDGWNANNKGNGTSYAVGEWVLPWTTTLYAKWSIVTYTIGYTLNGGSVASANPSSYNVTTTSFTLNNPSRDYYTFTGWTGSNGSTPQTTVTIAKGSTGNRTYAANWTPVPYNITYTLNSGSLPSGTSNPSSYCVTNAAITLVNPVRTGYTFTGWTGTDLSSATKSVTIPAGSHGARTYTANWSRDTYTIAYNLGDDASLPSGTSNPTSYNVDTATFTLNNPVRTGYAFTGWTGTGLSSATNTVKISKGSTGNRTYTANWSLITYHIYYTLGDGGTLPSGYPTSYTYTTPAFSLPDASRTGYNFRGWTGDGITTPRKPVSIAYNSTGDKTFTANWSPIYYTLTYDLAGGSLPSGASNPSVYCVTNAAITLVNPVRTGYTFDGWTGSNGSTPQKTVTIPAGSMNNRSYTAHWTPTTYNIAYDLAGGEMASGTPGPATYNIESGNITLANPTRTGYTFTGWTGSNGTTPQTAVTISTGSHGDKAYAANWTPLTVTFTFNANGGDGEMPARQFTSGEAQNLPSNIFVRADFVFAGWNTAANGSGTRFADGERIDLVTEPLTLYAQWAPAIFTLTSGSGDVTLYNGQTLTGAGGGNTHVAIDPGATVTLSNVTITAISDENEWSGITCLGDATIILVGSNTVFPGDCNYAGVQAGPPGTTLAIRGDGGLVTGCYNSDNTDNWGYGAGIGSTSDGACGNIVIEGGIISADGSGMGCGIGSGISGTCSNITISGGTVTAVGVRAICADSVLTIADGLEVLLSDENVTDEPVPYTNRVAACSRFYVTALVRPCVHDGGVFVEPGSGDTFCEYCGVPKKWYFGSGGAGTSADPWQLATTEDWDELASAVKDGLDTVGKFFRMTADIGSVSNRIGYLSYAQTNEFNGVFDGAGHTLTLCLSSSTAYLAPFSIVADATVRNLRVNGSVACSMESSCLIGRAAGTNLVENCLVSASIASRYGIVGGFVGTSFGSSTTLRGCTFAGSVDCSYHSTFWGEGRNGSTATLIDCLDLSESLSPIGCGNASDNPDLLCVSNVYYAQSGKNNGNYGIKWPADKLGKLMRSVTGGDGVSVGFGSPVATYDVSGITSYGTGIMYGGTFYAGAGDIVTLWPTAPNVYEFAATDGSLAPAGDGAWTLAMPDRNVSIVQKRYRVTLAPDRNEYLVPGNSWILVNGAQTSSFDVPSNAVVKAEYYCEFGWTAESFSVVTTNGTSVPCAVQDDGFCVFAEFTMPGSPVTVKPNVVATNYPAIAIGTADIASGVYAFTAPSNGVYSFTLGNSGVLNLYDALGDILYSTPSMLEDPVLAAGKTYYVVALTDQPTLALSVAQTAGVDAYPVTVVQPDHGTVTADLSEAPEGHLVLLTVTNAPGWAVTSVTVTGPNGTVDSFGDSLDELFYFEMPEGAVTVTVVCERSNRLRVGETPILFEQGDNECTFVAPADGWYRFRSGERIGSSFDLHLYDGTYNWIDIGEWWDDGSFDFLVHLQDGEDRILVVECDSDSAFETPVIVSCVTTNAIAVDDTIAHGSVTTRDWYGTEIESALEGELVLLESSPATDYGFGAWSVTDATGGVVSVAWNDDREFWYFRMPGTNVTVSATFGTRYAVTPKVTLRAMTYGWLWINNVFCGNSKPAAGAKVSMEYFCTPEWGVSSFSVVTDHGVSVPCTVDSAPPYYSAVFTMPDEPVTVTPNTVRLAGDVPTLDFGENIVTVGCWKFVAPSNGVYVMEMDPNDGRWSFETMDAGFQNPATGIDQTRRASLAAGETCYVTVSYYDSGRGVTRGPDATTLTITWAEDVATYPITINSAVAGKIATAITNAPAGREILVFPADGLSISSLGVTPRPSGWILGLLNYYSFYMPNSGVTLTASVKREGHLFLGENTIYRDNMNLDCEFTAPAAGWYNFRSADGSNSSVRDVYLGDDYHSIGDCRDGHGDFSFSVEMAAGETCWMTIACRTNAAFYASIFVATVESHPVTVEGGIEHGSLVVDDSAAEDASVYLDYVRDDGYALASLSVTDATGGVVAVQWDGARNDWYFRMPGTNVTVSATFGKPNAIELNYNAWTEFGSVLVNGGWAWPKEAAPGAEVQAAYGCCVGHELTSISIETTNGVIVSCDVRIDPDDPLLYYATFTMPDSPISITPNTARTTYPAIALGDTAIANSALRSFTAPTNGVYTFAVEGLDWYVYLNDGNSWDYIGNWDNGENAWRVPLVEGETCHVMIGFDYDNGGVPDVAVVTIARVDDVATYPVTLSPEAAGKATISMAEAPVGRMVTLTAAPGYGFSDDPVVAAQDGSDVRTEWIDASCFAFEMPASAVTVTAALAKIYAIAVDGGITNGSVVVSRNGDRIAEAAEGAEVFLHGYPDSGYGLGAWNIADATGGVVSVAWYDREECWYFRMPGTNVTVSAAFGTPHAINGSSGGMMATFCELVKVRGDRLGGQSRKAALGAEVEALYLCLPGYEIASFSVATADGTSIPCSLTRPDAEYGTEGLIAYYAVFTMPDAPVTITPNTVRAVRPALAVGNTTVTEPGIWSFVAPTNGVYSFAVTDPWDFFLMGEWEMLGYYDDTLDMYVVPLATGEKCYAAIAHYGSATEPTTVTIARVDDVTTYPISIDSEAAVAVAASVAEAIEGHIVMLAVAPGYALEEGPFVVDADGNEVYVDQVRDDLWFFEMPDAPVTVWAQCYRVCEIGLGENPVEIGSGTREYDMLECRFTPQADGWYRFTSAGDALPFNAGAAGVALVMGDLGFAYGTGNDGNGNIDLAVELMAGYTYRLTIYCRTNATFSASVFVTPAAKHAIAVDDAIAHGTIAAVDTDGDPVTEAAEGEMVLLAADPDLGFSDGLWTITDATGGVVSAQFDPYNEYWYFLMPGSSVTVSARFGKPEPITVLSDDYCRFNYLYVNGQWRDPFGSATAAPGATVHALCQIPPERSAASFSVVTADGASVPCTLHRDFRYYEEYYVVFTMPDAPVTVSLNTIGGALADRTLALGDNIVDDGYGFWKFVAPTNGLYSFAISDAWYLQISTERDELIDGFDYSGKWVVALAEGETCIVLVYRQSPGMRTTALAIARESDVETYPVTIDPAAAGKVTASLSEAPAGRQVRLFFAPGYYSWAEPEVKTADGYYVPFDVSIDGRSGVFEMPESAVTVTLPELYAMPPAYLNGADELVVSNYNAWAAKYGPDATGTHRPAFLLDIDPATVMPEGSNLLKVVNFSFSPTGIYFEVGSDITRFKERDPGYQQFLGNGFLSISAATTLSSNPDDWMVSPPMPFTIRDGKAVIDMQGDTAVGTAMPPSAFFKAIITPFYGSSTPPGPVVQPFEP